MSYRPALSVVVAAGFLLAGVMSFHAFSADLAPHGVGDGISDSVPGAQSVNPFHLVPASQLPLTLGEGDLSSFKNALERQIASCRKQNLKQTFWFGDHQITRQKWCVETNQRFLKLASEAKTFAEMMERARDQFDWYQSEGRDGKGEVLFTGYNFPVMEGSLVRTGEFSQPIYRRPDDLVRVTENGKTVWRKKNADGTYSLYPDRKAIDFEGALSGQGWELAYVRDPFTSFILHVEGSGAVLLRQPDGSVKRTVLNYAADNGRPYVALSKILRDQGVPEEDLTIPGMRRYFREHPEKLVPSLSRNPSYVFYQTDSEGPYGVSSLLLSPRHSVAIDLKVFPIGAVMLFQTQRPELNGDEVAGWKDFSSLAVTQDTGGAIVGPGRVDIYWGEDDYAEQASGRMKQLGSLFLAISR